MKKIILIIMCITVTLSVCNVAKCSDKNIKEKSYNEETFIMIFNLMSHKEFLESPVTEI